MDRASGHDPWIYDISAFIGSTAAKAADAIIAIDFYILYHSQYQLNILPWPQPIE
jgi:hypothetical protein